MGSDEAYNILKEMGETKYANYDTQMNKVKGQVAGLGTNSWTQNLYWSWLYSFQPIISSKGRAYPPFMQNQAWTRKDVQTALGSWTELKHDTILYAKQVMAEMGGGGPDNPPPHGYVEPNPEAYARLLALAQMTEDGLQSRNLLSGLTHGNLDNLISTLEFLKDISDRELSGGTITDDEYWQIQYWGGALEQFTIEAADSTDSTVRNELSSDQKAALVADVATGTNDLNTLVVLEEADGQPTPIYVVLPDPPWRVAVGAVYSYYEFSVPNSGRLTDEAWQAQLAVGTNPAQPDWIRCSRHPHLRPALPEVRANAWAPTTKSLSQWLDLIPTPSPQKGQITPGKGTHFISLQSSVILSCLSLVHRKSNQLNSVARVIRYQLLIGSQEIPEIDLLQYGGAATNNGNTFHCHYWTPILTNWQRNANTTIEALFARRPASFR